MFDGIVGRGRQTPCWVASAVVTFIYSYVDRVADGPAEEGLKTQDSTHLYFSLFLLLFCICPLLNSGA